MTTTLIVIGSCIALVVGFISWRFHKLGIGDITRRDG
jgi:hypothetical protein